jgi:hypothetical protein
MRAMLRMLFKTCAAVLLGAAIANAAAGTLSPTSVKVFGLVPDARSGALGGAYTAISDDAGCLNYNPAGLALIDHCEVPFEKTQLSGKVDQYSTGLFYSLRDVHIDNFYNPGTLAFTYNIYDQGSYPAGDENGNFVSDPKARGEVVSGAYGLTVLDDEYAGAFMLGFNAKFYKEEVLNTEYNWHAYDAGFLWNQAHGPLAAGVSIQNTNKDLHNSQRDSDLPQTARAGLSCGFLSKRLTVSSDYIKEIDEEARYAFGAEFNVVGPLVLRAGYRPNSANENNFSGGIGITLSQVGLHFLYAREICINYAYTSFVSSGDVQYCSVIIKLGAD